METNAATAFCRKSSVVVVAGKGGVGKSTVSAALARLAARQGLSVLLIELDEVGAVSQLFDNHESSSETVELSADATPHWDTKSAPVRALTITAEDVLVEYLRDHGFGRAAKRLSRSGMLDIAATGIPGVRDILVLGKILQLDRSHTADLIVVDGPAAGHAVSFLTCAQGVLDSSRAGPLHSLASDVVSFLSDPARCQVVLVTVAEETPVNETVETARTLEARVGVYLGPAIMNLMFPRLELLGADPEAAAAAAGITLRPGEADAIRSAAMFRCLRQEMQTEQANRLAEALPLPQLWLPKLFAAEIGFLEIDLLVDAMESGLTLLRDPVGRNGWLGPIKVAAGIGLAGRIAACE